MLPGSPAPLFACNTQWKCIGDLTPPLPLGAYVLNGSPLSNYFNKTGFIMDVKLNYCIILLLLLCILFTLVNHSVT